LNTLVKPWPVKVRTVAAAMLLLSLKTISGRS